MHVRMHVCMYVCKYVHMCVYLSSILLGEGEGAAYEGPGPQDGGPATPAGSTAAQDAGESTSWTQEIGE